MADGSMVQDACEASDAMASANPELATSSGTSSQLLFGRVYMWMRPSWDPQCTRTETERATTPYFNTDPQDTSFTALLRSSSSHSRGHAPCAESQL